MEKKKYVLSNYEGILESKDIAKERANNAPDQTSFEAGRLHGYADALEDVATQYKRTNEIFMGVLGYLSELWHDDQLYDVLHEGVGISDRELLELDFCFDFNEDNKKKEGA